MYTLHCTKKLLDRFKSVLVDPVLLDRRPTPP